VLINIVNTFNKRKKLVSAGEIIILQNKNMYSKFIIFTNIIILFYLILGIFRMRGHWLIVIPIFMCLLLITMYILFKTYKNINGIYKNGIIFNDYYPWNEFHSFKWVNNEEKIIFLRKTDNITISFEIGDGNIKEKTYSGILIWNRFLINLFVICW